MGDAALGELSHPEITENLTRKPFGAGSSDIEVAPHFSQKAANVTRAAIASVSVGEREHVPSAPETRCFRFFIVQPRGRDDTLLQPLRPGQQWVNFDGYTGLLRRVWTTCFIRDKPKGQRFALALCAQCDLTRCVVLSKRCRAVALRLLDLLASTLSSMLHGTHMPNSCIELIKRSARLMSSDVRING